MSDEPYPGSTVDFYERIQEYKGIGERLRESDERLSAALEEIERLKTIITELCNAVEWMAEKGYGPSRDLLQHAREATRCQ